MDAAAPLQLAQIHGRRDVIADDWYRAIAPMASVSLDVQVRQRVHDLNERIITLALTGLPSLDAARSISVVLARLYYFRPESLATTRTLAQQLVAELSAEQVMLLYFRLITLELIPFLARWNAHFIVALHPFNVILQRFPIGCTQFLTPSRQIRPAFSKKYSEFFAPLRVANVYTHQESVLG